MINGAELGTTVKVMSGSAGKYGEEEDNVTTPRISQDEFVLAWEHTCLEWRDSLFVRREDIEPWSSRSLFAKELRKEPNK